MLYKDFNAGVGKLTALCNKALPFLARDGTNVYVSSISLPMHINASSCISSTIREIRSDQISFSFIIEITQDPVIRRPGVIMIATKLFQFSKWRYT